ncbi:MAG: VWA domain-containing protein, partial [Pyrinomonadaceae bacterium]|nr:VWA domain-containing protein [Pyrinomonadaceae bacterium]
FKLPDIQSAALQFVAQLKPDDRVMVVSFDGEVKVLCQPTTYRYATKLAIEATKNGSGTSLYDALGKILEDELSNISGRKAIVLLTDGVDTTSKNFSASDVLRLLEQTDSLVYVIQYDTYDDVRKSRNALAETTYGEDGKPILVKGMPRKGEREDDYLLADKFLHDLASLSGGRKFRTSSNKVLSSAFFQIIEELRRVYILGYYPESARKRGSRYYIKVRVYRPNLVVRARKSYIQR